MVFWCLRVLSEGVQKVSLYLDSDQLETISRAADLFLKVAEKHCLVDLNSFLSSPAYLQHNANLSDNPTLLDSSGELDFLSAKIIKHKQMINDFRRVQYFYNAKTDVFVKDILELSRSPEEALIAIYFLDMGFDRVLRQRNLIQITKILFTRNLECQNFSDVEQRLAEINDFVSVFLNDIDYYTHLSDSLPSQFKKRIESIYALRILSQEKLMDWVQKGELKLSKAIQVSLSDTFLDKFFGINTQSYSHEQSTLLLENKYQDRIGYAPSPGNALASLIDLEMSSSDVFVDLGCGKGLVVLTVATKNIKKSVGVDIDPVLLSFAKSNAERKKYFPYIKSPIEFIQADVADYDLSEGTIFYLFNPFGPRTLENVLLKIKESLQTNPRKIRIITLAQNFERLLRAQPWLKLKEPDSVLPLIHDEYKIKIWEYEP